MDTILITGINGFLGSNLAKRLSKNNFILGLEQNTIDLFRLTGTDYKIYSAENLNLELLFKENTIDIIIHTATVYRKATDLIDNLLKTNILMPINLYELACKYNVPYFINTDSFFNCQGTTYNYLGDYTLSKRHLVEWLKMLQLNTKIVNMKLFHMYGPGDSASKFVTRLIIDLISNISKIEFTPGEQKRDFIYIDDIINAYCIVIDNLKNQKNTFIEYEVGTGQTYSIREFVNIVAQLTKSNSELLFGAIPYREGEMMKSVANNKKLIKLGWKINTSITDGCYKTISNYK